MSTTDQHKTALGRLLAEIGGIIGNLFNSTKKDFNSLPPDQQQAAINGSQISQIIKTGYAKGEAWVITQVTALTGLPADVATQTILSIAKDDGVNVTSVQAYLDALADKIQVGITNNKWNALFEDLAKFGATYLTQGKLDWVTLGLGIIQYAFQAFVKA